MQISNRMDVLPNNTPMGMYVNKKLYMLVVALVIVGGLNWLLVGTTGINGVKALLGRKLSSIVFILVGISALLLALRRDVYLPFLGQTVFPGAMLSAKTPQGANDTVTLTVRPGAKVVYWAAEPDAHKTGVAADWKEAYGSFENSGVVVADDMGTALLRIRGPPQPYKVPLKGTLRSHVHFRVEQEGGFFGPVQTKYIESGKVEGFANSL